MMDHAFDRLLEKAKKKKLIKIIPTAPKLRIDLIREKLKKLRDEYMYQANSMFKTKNRAVHLLDKGECAVLALQKLLIRRLEKIFLYL